MRKRASGNASMEKVLCVSVLVKFPRAETRAFLPQWKAGHSMADTQKIDKQTDRQKSDCNNLAFQD